MMKRRASPWARAALALLLAACGGDSTGPSTGSLAVTVTGLPGGASAHVAVAGPSGFSRVLSGTETLSGLAVGSYAVSADPVNAGGTLYAGSPAYQAVSVSEGSTPTEAMIAYTVVQNSLTVTIDGLPGGTDAAVEVTGPGGFAETITASKTFATVAVGSYTVTGAPVSVGGDLYVPSPSTQQVAVGASGSFAAAVTYSRSGTAGLNYRVDGVYLTQSVQTYAGTVPLVANRDGYLRVFVTATETNAPSPDVRVRFYHGGTQVSEQTIVRAGTTPLSPNEASLLSSWNLAVPKSLIQPTLTIRVDVDPSNLIAETNESDNGFPAGGLPLTPDVRTAAPFNVTMIPIVTGVDGRTGGVTAGNKDQFVVATMKMHPLPGFDATVGGALTVPSNVPALESDNGNNAWATILGQLNARRASDNSTRYYLGVVNPSYSSGVAGIGYVGDPVALAWDKLPSASLVAAHEWGHNWGRQHAPCGGANNPDAGFPYSAGNIGVYGFDVAALTLKQPSVPDLMGYCSNEWISDYTYKAVLQYRSAETGISSAMGQAVQPTIVLWGRVEKGRVVLEPAFQSVTRPKLPARGGEYSLEARAADGSRIFDLSFDPVPVADDPQGGAHFAFAVPLSPERAGRLSSLRLSGRGAVAELRSGATGTVPVSAARVAGGRVALRWDASRAPLVVVRHPRTGEILSFARGGRAEVVTDADELVLAPSDRVRSAAVRARVTR
ncbi:MAG TPA: CARDB domain-containing protein [Gemmatimonadales bacterium]|nr:CARDB domain-containing protein [Gemmatimonadales bacterium]